MHVRPLNLYLNKISNYIFFVTTDKYLTYQIGGQSLDAQNKCITSIGTEGVEKYQGK
jgi:hypothetical protein